MEITRIQYPIGQGCFHAGRIRPSAIDGQNDGTFHYVYDCGSDNQRALCKAINHYKTQTSRVDALFVSHLDNDHVNGLDQLLSVVKVNTVYVPYAKEDGIILYLIQAELDGILSVSLIEAVIDTDNWFKSRGVEEVVFVEESPEGGANDEEHQGSATNVELPRQGSRTSNTPDSKQSIKTGHVLIPASNSNPDLNWVLVPHVDPVSQTKQNNFLSNIRQKLGLSDEDPIESDQLAKALRDKDKRESLRECYNEIIPNGATRNHNRISMSLYSGPLKPEKEWRYRISCGTDFFPNKILGMWDYLGWIDTEGFVGWIGTGDATLKVKKVRDAWKGTYGGYQDHVLTLLLPHHGSRHNFHPEVLDFVKPKLCLASAGDPSRYRHPSKEVKMEVQIQGKWFHQISQKTQTMLCEKISL